MNIVGIDGCRYGWIFTCNNGKYGLAQNINDIAIQFPESIFLIDMPIGLSDQTFKRDIDQKLRSMLPHKSSSVFTPPCREAVYCKNYNEAKAKNILIEQKSISIQAWNISNKIQDLDEFLIQQPSYRLQFFEAFPELGFFRLNNDQALQWKKNDKKGLEERLALLSQIYKPAFKLYHNILGQTKIKDVRKDDILDALCLMAIGIVGETKGKQLIQTENNKDNMGIPIRIYSIYPIG